MDFEVIDKLSKTDKIEVNENTNNNISIGRNTYGLKLLGDNKNMRKIEVKTFLCAKLFCCFKKIRNKGHKINNDIIWLKNQTNFQYIIQSLIELNCIKDILYEGDKRFTSMIDRNTW